MQYYIQLGVRLWLSNQKVGGSIPVFPILNAEVGQDTEPNCPFSWRNALYECVCDWVNVKLYCKEL